MRRSWRPIGSSPTPTSSRSATTTFCASRLPRLDEIVLDWVAGPGFDRLLTETVRSVYPAHEHDQFIAHLRGLLGLRVRDESARLRAG
jgi:hypothetical protein